MLAISSVYPSGLERTAASVPRLVLAPGTVEHDERLAETLAEPVADQPRQQLGPAAGRERNDDLDRPGRIVLRARRCGDRGGDENSTQQEHAGFRSEQ